MSGAPRPLYWRLLRLRCVHPRAAVTFLLFEGSIVLGVLLALAEIISPLGAVTIPVAVAVMVKLNDVVAYAMLRPAAVEQLARPRLRDHPARGVSAVAPGGRPTALLELDDAVADPAARPDTLVARGVAAVRAVGRRPMPVTRAHELPLPDALAELEQRP
jgi:hypothetical protein